MKVAVLLRAPACFGVLAVAWSLGCTKGQSSATAPEPLPSPVASSGVERFVDAAPPPEEITTANARRLHAAAVAWRRAHPDECPAAERLRGERGLAPGDLLDAWSRPLTIECDDADTIVESSGPDGKPGTPDDVRVSK